MLEKILLKNLELKKYLVYIISLMIFAAVILILQDLININESLNVGGDAENIKLVFSLYYVLITIITMGFMGYSLKCYLKTRVSDFGIIRVLGASKKLVIKLLLAELVFAFFVAIFLGIVLGNIFIGVMIFSFKTQGIDVFLSISDTVTNCTNTILVSLLLFSFSILYSVFKSLRKNLSNVIQAGVKREYGYKYLSGLAFIGIAFILYSIYGLNNASLLETLVYLLICLAGVYIVFTFGLSFALIIVKRFFNRLYLRNIVIINDFFYKYKSSKKLIYISFLINFIILYIVGGIIVTTSVKTEYTKNYPFKNLLFDYKSDNSLTFLDNENRIKAFYCIVRTDDGAEEKAIGITCDEYLKMPNALTGYSNRAMVFNQDIDKSIDNDISVICLEYKEQMKEIPVDSNINEIIFGINIPSDVSYIVVLPKEFKLPDKTFNIYFNIDNQNVDKLSIVQKHNLFLRSEIIQKQENDNLILKISSYCLGIFSSLCSLAILALREENEIYTKKEKYRLLKYLGMSKKQRERNLSKEIMLFLIIPILFSNLLAWCFIKSEMIRVNLFSQEYILAFLIFQLILLIIQFSYYWIIKNIINNEIIN